MKVLLRNTSLPVFFYMLILCLSNYPGIKADIKSDFGQCTSKEIAHNSFKETCHIKFTEDRSIKYIKKLQKKTSKTCKVFKRSDYNKSTPSHVYMEAYGEIGNQLTAYAILYQLRYLSQRFSCKMLHHLYSLRLFQFDCRFFIYTLVCRQELIHSWITT